MEHNTEISENTQQESVPVMKRTIKDSVFTNLFKDKKYLIQLYQALHPDDKQTTEDDIKDITINNVLVDDIYNDLGFSVGNRLLILIEAQATWTVNILFRILMYLVQTYREYFRVTEQDTKLKMPKPELYIIYTGNRKERPEEISFSEEFFGGENICIDGCYPVDFSENVADLLTAAKHNEYEEYQDVYKNFAEKAKEEGFLKVAASFEMIAQIEKVHGDRFDYYLTLMKEGKLLKSDKKEIWVCQNCGYIHEGDSVPPICPSCRQENGYFMRAEHTPYGIGKAQ